jgi:hypothetical protein
MSRFTLDPESLSVQSFVLDQEASPVDEPSVVAPVPATVGGATCANTCWKTCGYTCDGRLECGIQSVVWICDSVHRVC